MAETASAKLRLRPDLGGSRVYAAFQDSNNDGVGDWPELCGGWIILLIVALTRSEFLDLFLPNGRLWL
jgi:hypothetical protein